MLSASPSTRPTVGVLIRFSNSAATLPAVLEGLRAQTVQPDEILGIDNGGYKACVAMIEQAGGTVLGWHTRYEHSKVLNFGLRHLTTDLVLILSSHTVLQAPDILERMVAAMDEPNTACVSGKWDEDPYYSDPIDWQELKKKGLKFGSIYSNSMGMIRRSRWEGQPFDENLPTAEDYGWAIAQLKGGQVCRRLDFPFTYARNGQARNDQFARITFRLAAQHGLKAAWPGPWASIKLFVSTCLRPSRPDSRPLRKLAWVRLLAWAGL